MQNQDLKILSRALDHLKSGFSGFPDDLEDEAKIQNILMEVATRMQNNFPYFQPQYAGQMLKPPHVIARLSYMLSLYINPNNHALDGGRASSEMEKEVIVEIAKMFGWKVSLGHLTSGGTVANLEALWVSGKIHPGKAIVASELSHYTHERISGVLKLPFNKIKCNQNGKLDLGHLEQEISKGNVGTVVVTMGTTGLGTVDPLDEILELQTKYAQFHPFRIHADAAYGGYFGLVSDLDVNMDFSLMAVDV
jgi:glutamate/tyrosine decarboxylase-like PLP-dependent enzyme